MAITKDDILKGFDAGEDVSAPSLLVDPEDLKRSVIEDQVAELRRQGAKAPMIGPRTPNPKNEAITGTQRPREVSLPEGLITGGIEGGGAAAGATAGALHGARLGLPFGPTGSLIGGAVGGAIGGGLGLAGTRAGVESGKAAFGVRPPITADEAIASGQRALLEGVAGEGVFRTLQMLPMGKRLFMERLLGGNISPEARATYEEAQKLGIHLTPGTLTESKGPKLLEASLRRTLGAGGKFTANDINNELKLREVVDQWADATMGGRLSSDAPELAVHKAGDIVQKVLNDEVIPEHRAFVKALYRDLDQKTGGAKIVDTTELYGQVQSIRDSLAKRGDTHKSAISALDDVLERISKKGNVTGLTVERQTEQLTKQIPGKTTITPSMQDTTAMIPGKSKTKITTAKTKDATPDIQSVERGTKPYDKGFVIPGSPEEQELRRIQTSTQWQKIKTGEQMTGLRATTQYQEIPAGERLLGLKVTEKSDAPRQPVPLTFSEAIDARTILGSEVGKGGPPLPANDKEKIKKVYALMTQNMGKAAIDFSKATGKDINLSWALANTMSERGKELFNESVMAKVIERDPEEVVKTVFKKEAISKTRDMMRALGNKPEAVNAYRRGALETLFQEGLDKDSGRVVGVKFAKAAQSRGEAVLKETFGETYPQLKKFMEIAERMPDQSTSGMLWVEQGLFLRSATSAISGAAGAGAVAGYMADSPSLMMGAVAAPAAWLITTRRLATIMTDKTLANKLLEVRSLKPGTQAFMRTMGQLGAIAVGETGQPVEQPRSMPSTMPYSVGNQE